MQNNENISQLVQTDFGKYCLRHKKLIFYEYKVNRAILRRIEWNKHVINACILKKLLSCWDYNSHTRVSLLRNTYVMMSKSLYAHKQ